MSNTIEVADIFRLFGPAYTESHSGQIPKRHLKAMFAKIAELLPWGVISMNVITVVLLVSPTIPVETDTVPNANPSLRKGGS